MQPHHQQAAACTPPRAATQMQQAALQGHLSPGEGSTMPGQWQPRQQPMQLGPQQYGTAAAGMAGYPASPAQQHAHALPTHQQLQPPTGGGAVGFGNAYLMSGEQQQAQQQQWDSRYEPHVQMNEAVGGWPASQVDSVCRLHCCFC